MLIKFNYGSAIAGWNNVSVSPGAGTVVPDLLDDQGNTTGIALESNYPNDFSDNETRATSAHHGLPEDFWDGIAFDSVEPIRHTLSGLSAYAGQNYTLTVAGFSKSGSVREMAFDVDGGTAQNYISTTSEPPNAPLTFTGTISGDTLVFTSTLVTGLAVLNGFTLELTPAQTPGLPSYNLNKDGADQASKSGIQVRVVAGSALNGSQLYYSNSVTTDANGDTSPIDLSSSAAAVNDTVLVTILTGDGYGIPFTDTVEDIS